MIKEKKQTRKELEDLIDENQIVPRTEVEYEDAEPDEEDGPQNELIDLEKGQIDRLNKEVFKFFDTFKTDRSDNESNWEDYEAQYDGSMIENDQMEFNLNVPVTMVKCDSVERLAIKAFTQSDPKFSSRLRPEAMSKAMDDSRIQEVQRNQEEYLDYLLDERINIASPLRKVLHQATTLEGGFMRIDWEFRRKRREAKEYYSGKAIQDPARPDDENAIIPEGLKGFLQKYPKAAVPGNEGHKYFKKLIKFEDANFMGTYWEVQYDDALPTFVDAKDFYARKSCEGYAGLCDEQCKIERETYTFWELKKLERADKFINVDEMANMNDETDTAKKVLDEDFEIKEHEVLRFDYYFLMNEDDKEESHIICWFGEHNKVFLGAILYPYHQVDCIYVPFYIKDKKKGLYKGGMAEILTDSNTAQNAILNMMLTETWLQLINTPVIKEGSSVAEQVLSGRWGPGVPLVTDAEVQSVAEEITYLPKPTTGIAGQLTNVLLFLGKMDDDRTGISSLMTGKESPTDPTAPAAKTAMLLKQSGINIEEYINCLLPSFNKVGEIILKLTYQMSTSSRRFRSNKIKAVTGSSDMYGVITRDEMILETVIQSQASGFAFDKVNEKRENLALYQILRQDPILMRNPDAVHEMAVTLCKSWSPLWKAKADKLLLTNEEFNQETVKIAMQALAAYIEQIKQAKMQSGQEAQPNLDGYLKVASQLMMQSVNPEPPEQKKQ